ncbi:MAG: hypothetical protein GXP31_04065 [Kiritimatiellaeota bacterium]|nr:hypothetical protein [Kiritimatiellota bacterium]
MQTALRSFLAACAVLAAGLVGFARGESTVDGLAGYWPLDENAGDRARDVVHPAPDLFGNRAEARILEPNWVPGRYGAALECRGQTALSVTKTADLNCTRQVTISAWVRPTDGGDRRAMIVNHEYAYRLALVKAKGGHRVQFQLNLDGNWAGNWLLGQTVLESGRWHFVACVYDGTTRRIYVDSRLDASEPVSGSIGTGRNMTLAAAQVRARRSRGPQQRTYVLREAFHGTLDEVRIWGRALAADTLRAAATEHRAAILQQLGPERTLYAYPIRAVLPPARDVPFTVGVFNGARTTFAGPARIEVKSTGADAGAGAVDRRMALRIDPGKLRVIQVPGDRFAPGTYTLRLTVGNWRPSDISVYVMPPATRADADELKLRPVLVRDLTQPLGPDVFLDDGSSRIVQTPVGAYREAGPKKFSRFAVRLPLRRTGLHLVRVRYPDDKPRTCEIAAWSPAPADRYNCHSGYFTDADTPLSHRVQTFEFIMWARDVRQVLVFTTWLDNRPAAAASVAVFEIDGRLPARPAALGPSRRWIGQYWEDAQPLSRCFGGTYPEYADFDRMTRNLCDYLDFTGQNLVMHPLVWYEGPIYNSLVESRGGKGGFYFPTDGWVDILLERFEQRGFKFFGLFNVQQLPSLVRDMNADLARVRAGDPTFNTVSGANEVFAKTWHHRLPMFNALHPVVQARVLALVREIAGRYGKSSAFGGVGFHLTLASLLQPGSIEVSYDDWTVAEFEKDTGVHVPIPVRAPDRFGQRRNWIQEHAADKWVAWRCRRTADFYGRVASALREKRADLKLVVTLLEPPMSIIDPQREAWRSGTPQVELSRAAGIDPQLLARIPNLVIQKRMGPSAKMKRLTFGLDRARWGAAAAPTLESVQAIRTMDLDPRLTAEYRTTPEFGVFLYNRYFESDVGRKHPMTCDWYGGIGWRATAVVPAGSQFMEYYARAMCLFDPELLAVGGFTNGTVGHEADVERFARVFRSLPSGRWNTVAGSGETADAPVVRTCTRDGLLWIYAVNPDRRARRIALPPGVDLAPIGDSPRPKDEARRRTVTLAPYGLAAWTGRAATAPATH